MMCIRIMNRNATEMVIKLLLAALLCLPGAVSALATDREKDIEIEADTAEIDDAKKVTIYTGDVIITQGTLRITGSKVSIYYDSDSNFVKLVSVGKPARFRQLPDGKEKIDRNYQAAHADRMEYIKAKDLIVLLGNAVYGQEGSKITADRIEYDSRKGRMRARSVKARTKTKTGKKKKSRVHIIIPAKKKKGG